MPLTIAVVGAGVIGVSLAHELTDRGADVTVLDRGEAGAGTTAATYGWVNAHDKTPEDYRALNLMGLRAHERVARTDTRGTWFHQTGLLEIARSEAEQEALEAKVRRLGRADYAAEMLTSSQLRRMEPGIRPEAVTAAAFFADEGWIDAPTMCSSLLQRAQAKGATFLPFHRVTEIGSDGLEAVGPDGRRRHLAADVVVVAAGNGTTTLLAPKGVHVPLVGAAARDGVEESHPSTVGLISTTSPLDSGIRHLVRATDLALRPARNGGVTFSDHPTDGGWDRTDPRIWTVPEQLLERARELFPSLARARTETVTVGTRVLPEDGLTIADRVDEGAVPVYVIATHSGITLAAHLGQVVAEEVLTGRRDDSLAPFGLARFAPHGARLHS